MWKSWRERAFLSKPPEKFCGRSGNLRVTTRASAVPGYPSPEIHPFRILIVNSPIKLFPDKFPTPF